MGWTLTAPSATVSIVLPALQERAFLVDCLNSLLAQDYDHVHEIFVVDGGSTDGTRELVGRFGPPVRLLDNPRVTAAAAMNLGIAEATGDIVCRADAHTLYAPDYVRRCVETLIETGAENVGGPMRPVGTTTFGRAVAAVTSSPFGIGGGRFHYSTRREEVDTVYLGCWWRSTLEAVGGYDEEGLQWAAEDQELNFRLRKKGGRVVLDPSIRSWYFPRDHPASLWRQYANYGVCKASTLRKHRSLPSWRPLAPAALVAATAIGLLPGRRAWLGIPVVHALTVSTAAARLASRPGVRADQAALALSICHWSYGLGFWSGIARVLLRRPFNNAPGRR